jgi:hypothetical protein
VAGATVTGRHLLAISQALRHIQKNRLIQYLIGVARCQSADRFKDLKRDLQFGERGLDHYDLRCASEVWLPDDAPNRIQPWAEEREMLLKAKERVLEDIGATELIETRLATLDDSAAGGGPGLIDDLFWPSSATNLAMKLRPNFAFWRFDYVDKASQADVYFTIASILHYRRSGSGTRMGLTDNDHHRVLLSPRSFDQFNDGVIQASLLRASHRSELNYSVDVERSRMMTDTLAFFLQNMRNQAGEAATEFLIALFNDKLKLGFSDHRNLLNMMRNLTHIDGINRVLRDILCTV